MPTYEYRCRTCDAVFERRRSMSEADDPVTCPDGHPEVVRLLSAFASVSALGGGDAPAGPCGGSCACYPG
jgi:putative FmdB family regulatory protein